MDDIERTLGGKWKNVAIIDVEQELLGKVGRGGVFYVTEQSLDVAGKLVSKAHVFNVINYNGRIIAIDMQRPAYGSIASILRHNKYSTSGSGVKFEFVYTGRPYT